MSSVSFDYSGQYLAAGGRDARIYGVKQDWQLLSTLSDLPQKVHHQHVPALWLLCCQFCLYEKQSSLAFLWKCIYGLKQDWQLLSTLSDLPQKVCH